MKPAQANHSALLRRTLVRYTHMQQIILLIATLLFVLYSLLLLYYRSAWKSIPTFTYDPSTGNRPDVSISVIIPARNEEKNLPALLNALAKQSYDQSLFEVLVVDDHSTDNTAGMVDGSVSNNIKLIRLKDHLDGSAINSYKKKAIEIAIGQSKGELIVTTDADCIVPDNWLQAIASFYEQTRAAFIVMPVVFLNRNNFLEIFQALDFIALQGITGAAVQKNALSMCNGANLAYTKKAFNAVEGFNGIQDIASGDDMLLMHKIQQQYPVGARYLRSKEVIVQTQAMHTWKEFINQRIRWSSKADKYDDQRIFWVLLLVYLFNVIMLALPVIAMFSNTGFSIFNIHFTLFSYWAGLLFLKTTIELIFLFPVANFFDRSYLLWWFPLAQPFHIIYTVMAGWLGKFGTYQWKERKVK